MFHESRVTRNLGYATDDRETAARLVGELIAPLDVGDTAPGRIEEVMQGYRCSELEAANYCDAYCINNVFDIHALNTGILEDPEYLDGRVKCFAGFETPENIAEFREDLKQRLAEQRKRLIFSCQDPTFWHRVLSEGRLYNPKEDDFTLTVEDKYPGTLALFDVEKIER